MLSKSYWQIIIDLSLPLEMDYSVLVIYIDMAFHQHTLYIETQHHINLQVTSFQIHAWFHTKILGCGSSWVIGPKYHFVVAIPPRPHTLGFGVPPKLPISTLPLREGGTSNTRKYLITGDTGPSSVYHCSILCIMNYSISVVSLHHIIKF